MENSQVFIHWMNFGDPPIKKITCSFKDCKAFEFTNDPVTQQCRRKGCEHYTCMVHLFDVIIRGGDCGPCHEEWKAKKQFQKSRQLGVSGMITNHQ